MKLALKDVSKRVVIKLDKSITADNVSGVMNFGNNNDYPQLIERLVNSSITAKSVSNIYSKFLAGNGFENEAINSIVIGKDSKGKEITVRKLLRQCCDYIAVNNGCYVHVNKNLENKVVDCKPIPFKNCRFASLDDNGYTAKIGVYDNWEKDPDNKKNNQTIFDKNKIRWYNLFTSDENALASQVKNAGGPEKFKGQIFFHFLDNQYLYPLSPFDSVDLDMDTEYQVSIFKNNMTRNGMTKKTVMRMSEPSDADDEKELQEQVKDWQGAGGSNTLVLYDEFDPATGEIKSNGAFKIDSIDSNIDDKLFENWNKELANNIRKAVRALPGILIDYEEGKLSTTSGESIIQATNFFNAMTQDDRTSISEMFKELFSNSIEPTLASNTNWNIKKLSLYENGNATTV